MFYFAAAVDERVAGKIRHDAVFCFLPRCLLRMVGTCDEMISTGYKMPVAARWRRVGAGEKMRVRLLLPCCLLPSLQRRRFTLLLSVWRCYTITIYYATLLPRAVDDAARDAAHTPY